jgi:UDP-N-acetylglucosamine 2-epimerase
MPRIAIVVGTRPQIIKSAPVIRKLSDSRRLDISIVHTGQHYDYELSKVFFNELGLPDPFINLGIQGSTSHARQTGAMMIGLERAFSRLAPNFVLVPGDTNSALAAALAAVKLGIPCAHLESGPRQFDLSNPEEANRVVIDHLSTIAFAPTRSSVRNLQREGLEDRIVFSGDTMLDCLIEHISSSLKIDVCSRFALDPGFVLTTIHRQENTEDVTRLKGIVKLMISLKKLRFAFPLHPRTKNRLNSFSLIRKLRTARNVHLMPPLDYETNLAMISKAKIVMTDSGGLQKEAFWQGVPCITVFRSTPWPETLSGGSNHCIEPDVSSFSKAQSEMKSVRFHQKRAYALFGNGQASEKVCRALMEI